MKLRNKDILPLVISIIVIIASIIFLVKTLSPAKPKDQSSLNPEANKTIEESKKISEGINSKVYEEVEKLNDYGKPALENIGKENPFGPIN